MFNTSVVGVSAKSVHRKSDGREIVIYQVEDAETRIWTTTKKQLASEANRLIGHQVTIDGRVVPNGDFMNHYLEDIVPQNGNASNTFIQPAATVTAPAPLPAPIPAPTPPPPLPTQGSTEKDWMIARQTAAKVSAHLSSNATEFWANLDHLVSYFILGEKPSHIPGDPTTGNKFIPEAAIQQAITSDPGSDAPFLGDDDIPF